MEVEEEEMEEGDEETSTPVLTKIQNNPSQWETLNFNSLNNWYNDT